MKKLVLVLAVLLCAAPAIATDVTITAVAGPGPNDVTVGFSSTGTPIVRAIALDVQLDDPNVVIGDINCVSAGYGIYPGSISIDASGTVTDWGTCAGAGLDSNLVATEQGSLYVGAANAPAQGDLFIITLEGCTADGSGDVVVSITEDALRGGVVLEDPDVAANVTLPSDVTVTGLPSCVVPGCACLGDIADTTSIGAPDGIVNTGDMAALLTALILGGGGPGDDYTIVAPSQDLLDCMDLADTSSIGPPDGLINTGDMASLLTHLILFGNPASNYDAPCK